MSGEIGRVGDDILDVRDVLRKVDATEEFDVNVVELECVDGCEGIAVEDISPERV
jgi:hypothetical protein